MCRYCLHSYKKLVQILKVDKANGSKTRHWGGYKSLSLHTHWVWSEPHFYNGTRRANDFKIAKHIPGLLFRFWQPAPAFSQFKKKRWVTRQGRETALLSYKVIPPGQNQQQEAFTINSHAGGLSCLYFLTKKKTPVNQCTLKRAIEGILKILSRAGCSGTHL